MSLSHYSAQCEPSLSHLLPPGRRLVIIDTASRIATRILARQRAGQMIVTSDTTANEIEQFRLSNGGPVFASITDELSKHNSKQT